MNIESAWRFVSSYVKPVEATHLTAEELRERLAREPIAVIDVNPRGRFARGHIEGALHAEWDATDLSFLPADRHAAVVFYCGNSL